MSIPSPRISVVTASYNQGCFLEETIRSVLSQSYPNLEYIIVDGGSSDDSVEIIKKYQTHLAWWISEKDAGQFDALNKGFARCTGEIMTWINSDDLLLPWALQTVSQIFSKFPNVEWLAPLLSFHLDAQGAPANCWEMDGFSRKAFFRGAYLPGGGWPAEYYIQQEGTFWRRGLWQRAGASLDASLNCAGDFELWARFFRHAELFAVKLPLGAFRRHPGQKTAHRMDVYFAEAKAALLRHGGVFPPAWRCLAVRKLLKLHRFFHKRYLRTLADGDQLKYVVNSGRDDGWELKSVR